MALAAALTAVVLTVEAALPATRSTRATPRAADTAVLDDRPAAAGAAIADTRTDRMTIYKGREMYRELTPQEEQVIVRKGTEPPFSGQYNTHFEKGVYTCRRCGAELFESSSKFRSDCGWPSFDDRIPGAIKRQRDRDGRRTEVLCAKCGAHLGHLFVGERFTPKNARYCVNSISMDFIPAEQRTQKAAAQAAASPDASNPKSGISNLKSEISNPQSAIPSPPSQERALFASGCFWGTEYYIQRAPGVISTTVGYTGGRTENPTYKQVCTGRTGHAETVEVIFDPSKTSYEKLAKLFFETHDFTQLNRQGPDIGTQYRSAIFYLTDEQKQIAERLTQQLREKGYNVKTEITQAGKFWPAEDYHQDYYNTTGKTPYCHLYRKIF
jgi:peptide methionine sulfoxide reductase msrA/msrB